MQRGNRPDGFTLVELLVVLLLIALLAGVATPVVNRAIESAREATLREDLFVVRKTLDDYFADHGHYPERLEQLVQERYLRAIPVDPLTGRRDSWLLERVEEASVDNGIINIRSGASGEASDGSRYRDW